MIRFIILSLLVMIINCAPVFQVYLREGEKINNQHRIKIIRVDTLIDNVTKDRIIRYDYIETKK